MKEPSIEACPLCASTVGVEITDHVDMVPGKWRVNCPRCGEYKIVSETRVSALRHRDDLYRLSGLTREKTERKRARPHHQGQHEEHIDIVSGLDPKDLESLFAQTPHEFDIATKVRKLLAALARKSRKPGDDVQINDDIDYPLAYARDGEELRYFVNYAVAIGWLTSNNNTHSMLVRLTPKGWEEAQHPARIDSTTAFVAMWFDNSLTSVYTDGIRSAIEDECGYRAVRVDLEDTNNDDIVDEILAQIRASRFVVADVTGHRNGVYFEAGFAKGLGIPVIWTCKQGGFDEHRTFDTEHFNHILWNDAADLRAKLANRIKSTIDVALARRDSSMR
jgi:hypothetical protein